MGVVFYRTCLVGILFAGFERGKWNAFGDCLYALGKCWDTWDNFGGLVFFWAEVKTYRLDWNFCGYCRSDSFENRIKAVCVVAK